MTLKIIEPRIIFSLCFLMLLGALVEGTNLSCYQCIKNTNEECGIESLLPCSAISDRCVTHITKNDEQGFTLKRECGLGPCGFDDAMMNKGLGWDTCDRSNDEYVCLFCCKDSGCNKSGTVLFSPSIILIITLVLIVLLNIYERFQPPYIASPEKDI